MREPTAPHSSAFAETWAQFCALESTLGPTHDAIASWRRGRERYAVWALRVRDPVVGDRMDTVAARLTDAIVPVRKDDAHITAWVCGFLCATPAFDDDVAEAIIAAQCRAVAQSPRPRLLVGAANAFATCAFLEVHDPHGDLAALRATLAVPGAKEVRFARYRPHVTVGRFVDTRPAAPIAAVLESLRSALVELRAVRDLDLELIELDARAPDRLTTIWPQYRRNAAAAAAPPGPPP